MAFYGTLTCLMLLILTGTLDNVLPSRWATRVAYNSEGYLFAIGLGAWIQGVRPRHLTDTGRAWSVVVGVLLLSVGALLLASDLPSRIRTLNETFFALGVLVPYVSLDRPLPREVGWLGPALFLGVALGAALQADWVVDQAETFGLVVLTLISLDVVDRGILDPHATSLPTRASWYAVLALEPVVVSTLGTGMREGTGGIAVMLDYLGRVHESFIGVLLVVIFLAVCLGRAGAPAATQPEYVSARRSRG